MVSIIVPIYNAEKTIARCVESILKQDYRDFELLLMDDGSKDDSGKICDEYAEKDARVRVIHKANSGVSDTRNQAIALAKGDYLQFVDADDWLTPEATNLMVRALTENDSDMVITDFYRVVAERVSHKGSIETDGLLTQIEFANCMMEKPADFYYGVLWNKLFKKSIIDEFGLKMDKEISWCEDFMFNLEYIRHIKTVYALRVPVYYYVKTKGSLVSQGMSLTKTIEMKTNVFSHYNAFYKDVFGEEDYEKSKLQVYRFLLDAAGDGLVPPAILPGIKKLGNERTTVSTEVAEGEGILLDIYRERKLLDRCLETQAIKHDISLIEARILLYLKQCDKKTVFKEVAGVTGITWAEVMMAVQGLSNKGIILKEKDDTAADKEKSEEKHIEWIWGDKKDDKKDDKKEDKKEDKHIEWFWGDKKDDKKDDKDADKLTEKVAEKAAEKDKNPYLDKVAFSEEGEAIVADIIKSYEDFLQIKYEGLSEEEIEQYIMISEKINANVRNSLG